MRVSRERLKIEPVVGGRESKAGWLVVDLKALELEGVQRLEVDLDDVEALRSRQDQARNLFESLRSKLPGD
jgi:hypothetical protein